MGRGYTTDEHRLMVRMWSEGATIARIADAVGRSPKGGVRVHIQRCRAEFPARRTYVTAEEHDEMVALKARGWSNARIAGYMGVPKSTVTRHVREAR